MIDERTEKQQKSVDRARAQSHLILRRSLNELRNLQKGRSLKEQVADQLPDFQGRAHFRRGTRRYGRLNEPRRKPTRPALPRIRPEFVL